VEKLLFFESAGDKWKLIVDKESLCVEVKQSANIRELTADRIAAGRSSVSADMSSAYKCTRC